MPEAGTLPNHVSTAQNETNPILSLINNTMNYFQVQSFWQMVIRALIILAVIVAYTGGR
jgi:predicted ABC-type sugar transport system permease subunit